MQLEDLLATGGRINWEVRGFSTSAIRKNAIQGKNNKGEFISLLPVENEAVLTEHIAGVQMESEEFAQIIDETEAASIKADILAVRQAQEEAAALTPTDEDLYRASVLKLLTEMKVNQQGGEGNV